MSMQSMNAKSSETAVMLLDAWHRRDMAAVVAHVDTPEASKGFSGCSSLESEQQDLLAGIALALRPCIGTRDFNAEAEACLHLLRHLAKRTRVA
jgi:hypothetical protein